MLSAMDPVRFGADVRILRLRKRWTQRRLATEAGVKRWVVTEIESGRGDNIAAKRLVAVVRAVGGAVTLRVQFQGEALDRLRDRRHARLVELIVTQLRAEGWLVATEVSFNVYGERGSIDVLAFHPATRALLVIEVKSVVPDVGSMLMTMDRKARLASDVARRQLGWDADAVSKLLILPEDRTARRRVADHATTFDVAFPDRNVTVRHWLRSPVGVVAGVMFLTDAQDVDRKRKTTPGRAML